MIIGIANKWNHQLPKYERASRELIDELNETESDPGGSA